MSYGTYTFADVLRRDVIHVETMRALVATARHGLTQVTYGEATMRAIQESNELIVALDALVTDLSQRQAVA